MPEKLFKVETVPRTGRGAMASRKLVAGTLILAERPTFLISSSPRDSQAFKSEMLLQLLEQSEEIQEEFYQLHNRYPNLPTIEGIIKTNAIPFGNHPRQDGLFLGFSRFNHSCSANAAYSWHEGLQELRIYSLKEIEAGEEITVSYVSEHHWAHPRNERQAYFRAKFGFDCLCKECHMDAESTKESDERRRKISSMQATLENYPLILQSPNKAMGICRSIINLLLEEGEGGPLLEVAYYNAFHVCVMHGDLARASCFAKLSLETTKLWKGGDAHNIEELQSLVTNPQLHPSANRTGRWRLGVEFARMIESDGFEEWLWSRDSHSSYQRDRWSLMGIH